MAGGVGWSGGHSERSRAFAQQLRSFGDSLRELEKPCGGASEKPQKIAPISHASLSLFFEIVSGIYPAFVVPGQINWRSPEPPGRWSSDMGVHIASPASIAPWDQRCVRTFQTTVLRPSRSVAGHLYTPRNVFNAFRGGGGGSDHILIPSVFKIPPQESFNSLSARFRMPSTSHLSPHLRVTARTVRCEPVLVRFH